MDSSEFPMANALLLRRSQYRTSEVRIRRFRLFEEDHKGTFDMCERIHYNVLYSPALL
jgi:hypothetical protein